MTAIYRHDGRALDYTPEADVAAGNVIVLNGLVAIATSPIAAGDLGALAVEGVFEIPKNDGDEAGQGDHAFWDADDEVVRLDDEDGTYPAMGHLARAAAAEDTTCYVRLCPGVIADDDSGSAGSE